MKLGSLIPVRTLNKKARFKKRKKHGRTQRVEIEKSFLKW